MYESPIQQITTEMQFMYENECMKIVQGCGFDVNKEELLKALAYDRNQYDKGYADAEEKHRWIPCSERLPEDEQIVFVQLDSEYQLSCEDETPMRVMKYEESIAGFSWKEIGFNEWHMDATVIAWQPLPAPYVPKEDKQK